MTLIDSLIAQGFDKSYRKERDDYGRFTAACNVWCSQCEARVIQGIACHETRCPNIPREENDYE